MKQAQEVKMSWILFQKLKWVSRKWKYEEYQKQHKH